MSQDQIMSSVKIFCCSLGGNAELDDLAQEMGYDLDQEVERTIYDEEIDEGGEKATRQVISILHDDQFANSVVQFKQRLSEMQGSGDSNHNISAHKQKKNDEDDV